MGSLEWLRYFGLPIGMLMFGLITTFFVLTDPENSKNDTLINSIAIYGFIGLLTLIIQKQRLKFRTFKTDDDNDNLRNVIRQMLVDNGWRLDYDNKKFMQATYVNSLFNFDMVTLKFGKNEISWNVIHHPASLNSIASVFTLNRKGRNMIKKIKTCA